MGLFQCAFEFNMPASMPSAIDTNTTSPCSPPLRVTNPPASPLRCPNTRQRRVVRLHRIHNHIIFRRPKSVDRLHLVSVIINNFSIRLDLSNQQKLLPDLSTSWGDAKHQNDVVAIHEPNEEIGSDAQTSAAMSTKSIIGATWSCYNCSSLPFYTFSGTPRFCIEDSP